jgi:hypothetical protein
MPRVATKSRGTGGKQAKVIMNFTNCLWTILEDGAFWTIAMDEQGGFTTAVHGVVCSPATASTSYRCPQTMKKVSVLMFDVCGLLLVYHASGDPTIITDGRWRCATTQPN